MERSHGVILPQTRGVNVGGGGFTTYVVSLPRILKSMECSVPGCPVISYSADRMQENFMYRYACPKVAVLQEGRETLPRCDMCGMHMPAGRMLKHQRTARCFKNTDMRIRHRDLEIASWFWICN